MTPETRDTVVGVIIALALGLLGGSALTLMLAWLR
jgi:hypothetical protein